MKSSRLFIPALILVLSTSLLCLPEKAGAQTRQQLLQENKMLKEYIGRLESVIDSLIKGYDVKYHVTYGWMEKLPAAPVLSSVEPLNEQPAKEPAKEPADEEELFAMRLAEFKDFADVPYSSVMGQEIRSLMSREDAPRVLGLFEMYAPEVRNIFKKYNVPEDLAALMIYESGAEVNAVSWEGYMGLWRMPYALGRNYGLSINSSSDDRIDVAKSTEALAKYLSDAHSRFGKWSLAVASYNCGASNVLKAIEKAGGKDGIEDIYPYLPGETRDCVTSFLADLYAVNYYSQHGLVAEDSPVPAPSSIPAAAVAGPDLAVADTRTEPEIEPAVEPAKAEETIAPKQAVAVTQPAAKPAKKPATKASAKTTSTKSKSYTVRSGDNLYTIAKRNGTTVSKLKSINGLKSDKLKPGQKLKVK